MTHMYFSAGAEGHISYGHLGRTNLYYIILYRLYTVNIYTSLYSLYFVFVTKYSTSNSSATSSSSSSSSSSTILSLIIHYLSYVRVCHLSVYSSIRIQVRTTALFIRESEQGLQRIRGHFHTLPQLVNSSTPLDVDSILSSLNQQVDNFNARGSGYVIERLLQFVLVVTEYRPLCGSSYIPTPKRLQNKHCIVNVQNSDQKCFLYSILAVFTRHRLTEIV